MKPYVVAVVFARGGSKGIPGKNLRMLAGRPLIAYAIEVARATPLIDRVVVSTDDPSIAEVARRWKAEVPFMRPAELARDDSPEWEAWQHAVRTLMESSPGESLGALISIPTTAPLRAVADVETCIQVLLGSDVDAVITVTPARRNPYFNMVTIEDGYARPVLSLTDRSIHRRQDAPTVFDMTTVAFAVRPQFVLSSDSLFAGRVKAVVVPESRALDIDTPLDLEFAEFLLARSRHAAFHKSQGARTRTRALRRDRTAS